MLKFISLKIKRLTLDSIKAIDFLNTKYFKMKK